MRKAFLTLATTLALVGCSKDEAAPGVELDPKTTLEGAILRGDADGVAMYLA